MNRKNFFVIILIACLLFCNFNFSHIAYASSGPTAFEGPFFWTGLTTTTYKYFTDASNGASNNGTVNTKTIDSSATKTVTEEQILTFFLHTPINYDESKSYPIISYCSGDGITLYIDKDTDFGSITQVDASTYSDESPFKKYLYSYLYTEGHSNQLYNQTWGGNQLLNSDGTIAEHTTSWLPHYGAGSGNCDDQFVENWYDLVYNQGKEEYDCFFIFVQPTDRSWYSNSSNTKMATIRNLTKDTTIYKKYSDSIQTNTNTEAGSTYITSELCANTNEQLLVQLIDNLASKYSIDLSRQYLAGFSLGALFSYDIACHYPERFACVLTTGLPTCDLTDDNCKALINTNFWLFNGSSDYCDAKSVWGSQFVEKLNSFSSSLGGSGSAKYTVISGGHNGKYIAGEGTYVSGSTLASSTATYDFMFSSVRDYCQISQFESEKFGVEDLTLSAKVSKTIDNDTYDLAIISGAPIGDFAQYGFVITTSEEKTHDYDKTKLIKVNGMTKTANITLGDEQMTLNATDYVSPLLYYYKLTNIPKSITSFSALAYAKTSNSIFYSKSITITISINESQITLTVE